ncbi:MAG: class I SAM-dependent methyltransferase [Candidatus Marinimicrobia bacterium]|nr:class I SAM-dependent methyltransferase [Candidatus Neomarinimicrobiota bacterium]
MITRDIKQVQFRTDRLARLAQIERWHFWFIGRRALVNRLLAKYIGNGTKRLLDIGCGTGIMVEILSAQGHKVVGLDLLPQGLRSTRHKVPHSMLIQADLSIQLPLSDKVFDVVIVLDVLEHVDDESLLEEVNRVLNPGGIILLTVPAFPWLWSFRDEDAGHLRRYTRKSIHDLMSKSDLQIIETRYYQFFLFPFIAMTRLIGRKRKEMRDFEEQPIWVINKALSWINRLEVWLSDYIPLPYGSSMAIVCQKS